MENPAFDTIHKLVLRYGWNSVAYQILNPGFSYWVSPEQDAVVGYVARKGYWVVGGAPICAPARLPEVTRLFQEAAYAQRCRVVYFGAGVRLYDKGYKPPAHAVVALGAQPVWNPARWESRVHRHASLRMQFNRARNKGVIIAEWPWSAAERSPQLQHCLDDWLKRRPMPPMHFLVEPETLGFLEDRRTFVAERRGHVVGFLILSPIPAQNGWLVEQIIRHRTAPNGTSELLLDQAMRAIAASGSTYATLGLAPLSRRSAQAQQAAQANPLWLRLLLQWVRAHGRRFYNFDGLDAFKAKFDPEEWEPVFAITSEPTFSPAALYAIAAAFSDGSPWSQGARALQKAVSTEMGRLRRRMRR